MEKEQLQQITDKLVPLLEGVGFRVRNIEHDPDTWIGSENRIYFDGIEERVIVRCSTTGRFIIGASRPRDQTIDSICSMWIRDGDESPPNYSTFVNECADKIVA